MRNREGKQGRLTERDDASEVAQPSPGKSTLVESVYFDTSEGGRARTGTIQRKGGSGAPDAAHAVADAGISGAGGALPFRHTIQTLFGRHDVSDVRAHSDTAAVAANGSLGSTAYAKGNNIAFARAPDLHTAAHEAAHVVQQRAGVQLKGGVGESGDPYERHADAVADKIVQGESAEALLSSMAGGSSTTSAVQHQMLQFLGAPLDHKLPPGAEAPAFGEDEGEQRRYSVEQYIAMWEKEQGRKITPTEKTTIERGCIGVTANNLHGGGNPVKLAEATYGTFEQAHAEMKKRNSVLDKLRVGSLRNTPLGSSTTAKSRYVLFAQLFWSNQSGNFAARTKPDPKAFLPDPKTGKLDMSSYNSEARSKDDGSNDSYINFDFGFWDDASHCFWHANHRRFKEPAKDAAAPMEIFQSTKDHFITGYKDFDRAVFCVALATNYDPRLAVISHTTSRR